MAGSQLPPLLIAALALYLHLPEGSLTTDSTEGATLPGTESSSVPPTLSSVFDFSALSSGSAPTSPLSLSSSEGTPTSLPSAPSSEDTSTTQPGSSPTDPRTASASRPPVTVTRAASDAATPDITPATGVTLLPASPGPGQGDPGTPTSHRNPAVVVAVCLLVSVLLVGSVVAAVTCWGRGEAEFRSLDEVSMVSTSRRSSVALQPPE